MIYRQFGIDFTCDFPLPELASRDGGEPRFRVTWGSAKEHSGETFETRYDFLDRAGRQVCFTARDGGDFMLVFPGSVRFLFRDEQEICCMPEPGCESELVRLLLLNQVIPRFLGSEGHLVLHASAVVFPETNTAVAFLGNTGFGKSTLASALHREGAPLISDDGILLRSLREGVGAWGGPSVIRLLPDSLKEIFGDTGISDVEVPRSAKRQVPFNDEAGIAEDGQLLSALFVLNDPFEQTTHIDIGIVPLAGADALMAVIHCLFNLDPSDSAVAARAFRSASKVFSPPLPVYSLAYPRDHERLPEVLAEVRRVIA